jgi:peptidoglycan/xylan/chitin deacetylase (PgdA/CDA1 family)
MRKALLIAAALGAAWASPAPAPIAPAIARALRIPRRTPDAGGVALTFDDGPHPQGTLAVMEALREAAAPATFFLVGEQVVRNPSLAAEIVAGGHSVALHGHRHRTLLRLTPSEFAADLERGIATISDSTGVQPTVYRPPYGVFSAAGVGIVRRRGLRTLLWSRWGHDWRARSTADAIAAEVSSGLGGGDVLLLHDADHYSAPGSWKRTAAALPQVLAAIEAAGLRAIAI